MWYHGSRNQADNQYLIGKQAGCSHIAVSSNINGNLSGRKKCGSKKSNSNQSSTNHCITITKWPANSLYLNLIEYLLKIVKRKIRDTIFNTTAVLKTRPCCTDAPTRYWIYLQYSPWTCFLVDWHLSTKHILDKLNVGVIRCKPYIIIAMIHFYYNDLLS